MSLKRKAGDVALTDAKKTKTNSTITSFFKAPKPKTPTSAKPTDKSSLEPGSSAPEGSIPASSPTPVVETEWKKKWLDGLTEEQKNLLVLEIETLHDSWLKELKDEIKSSSFLELKRFLKREHDSGKKIFPPAQDVYAWYYYLPLHNLQY
jgi:uracil-DNA glycosylase